LGSTRSSYAQAGVMTKRAWTRSRRSIANGP
jgi:hypothetical protein